MDYRIGFSKDIHRLVENRELIIGGVVVPFEKGELAHSDGDVLYHALAESILGALALGDLGKHFPDTSDETLDMDSGVIVSKVVKMMFERGYEVNNVDIFVSLERPKLKDYIESMRNNVAKLLQVNIDQVSIKAGTNEKCGEVGKGEAIEATSMILLRKK
ncbi:MAG: 2-C-methyl-D-erythritol 2,4-cyclodiphosphate synthase [Bacilli bacterium]|nr:2-C-methyl-D-erythritol 2,4-cyclodiphosphate synthase [Bacilli bacterium]